MCSREDFIKVFDKLIGEEIEDIQTNYDLPASVATWVKAVSNGNAIIEKITDSLLLAS